MGLFGLGKAKDITYTTSESMTVGYRGKRVESIAFNGDGDYETPVVGLSYHRDTIDGIVDQLDPTTGGVEVVRAQLLREPRNPHDRNAIRVTVHSATAGYVPREVAVGLAQWIDSQGQGLLFTCPAMVRWNFGDRQVRSVRLDIAYDGAAIARREEVAGELEAVTEAVRAAEAAGRVKELWSTASKPGGEVLGESAFFAHITELVRSRAGVSTFGPSGEEISLDVLLVPGARVDVYVAAGGSPVGRLPEETATSIRGELAALSATGVIGQVRGRAWCNGSIASVEVDVDPDVPMVPVNDPPSERYATLPEGRAIQLTGEEHYLEFLAGVLAGAPQRSAWVTVHQVEGKGGKQAVEVRLNGSPVGGLTPGVTAEILPLVQHLAAAGLTAAARGWVKGNALKADVTFRSAKASEVPAAWIAAHGPATLAP